MSSTRTENEPKDAAVADAVAVADADANSSDSDVPQIYIMIENPKKSNNLGPILRCGAAYCATFIFIGFQKCAVDGSHGADKHVSILSFPTFGQACQYVRSQGVDVDVDVDVGGRVGANGCVGGNVGSITGILGAASFRKGGHDDVREVIVDEDGNENENGTTRTIKVGGEIGTPGDDFGDGRERDHEREHAHERGHKYPCSHPIHLRPFKEGPKKNICFLISKKAAGIPKDQAKFCDTFVHISTSVPFPLKAERESESESESESVMHGMLDSQTSLSICLHHFAAKWNFKERDFDSLQQKFEVADPKRNQVDEERSGRLREARRRQKEDEEQALDDAWESGEMANMIHLFD